MKSSGSLEMAISGNNAAVAALTRVQRRGEVACLCGVSE